jgi:hypothetical protein
LTERTKHALLQYPRRYRTPHGAGQPPVVYQPRKQYRCQDRHCLYRFHTTVGQGLERGGTGSAPCCYRYTRYRAESRRGTEISQKETIQEINETGTRYFIWHRVAPHRFALRLRAEFQHVHCLGCCVSLMAMDNGCWDAQIQETGNLSSCRV